jgi:hypothetical protein
LAEDFRITGMTHIIAISGEIAITLVAQIMAGTWDSIGTS